jgi:2-dehydropantoate 2-reductase
MTRVCIVGAGAIGGVIGARLAASGQARVCAIARGATLNALRQHGWRLKSPAGDVNEAADASDDPTDFGCQDVVFIAVKGPSLQQVVQSISPLLGLSTIVVPAMNGVPWWFCNGIAEFENEGLRGIDPSGEISRTIPFASVLGCVVHASARQVAPGLVEEKVWDKIVFGEPQGGLSDRAATVTALLASAGCTASQSADVRSEIWYKLWGNLTMNPVSAMTGATIDRISSDPLVRDFCSAAMREATAIGQRIGCRIEQSPEDRHRVTAALGAFKTSMLQDAEAGRALELDAIVTAVHEMGRRVGVATPNVDALLGLTRLFARTRGLYPDES